MGDSLSWAADRVAEEAEEAFQEKRKALPDDIRARLDSALWVAESYRRALHKVGLCTGSVDAICVDLKYCGADWRSRGVEP